MKVEMSCNKCKSNLFEMELEFKSVLPFLGINDVDESFNLPVNIKFTCLGCGHSFVLEECWVASSNLIAKE